MKSQDLAAVLAPFKLLANKHALSPTYRSIEIGPDRLRACSTFASLEVAVKLGVESEEGPIKEPFYVDATIFLAVVDSLPAGEDVQLGLTDGRVLEWEAGGARGRIACAIVKEMQAIPPQKIKAGQGFKPTADFRTAIELGALSCDSQALQSESLYGVVLDTREGGIMILACDNTTISASQVDADAPKGTPGLMTFPPEAIPLIVRVCKDAGEIAFGEASLYYQDETSRMLIKQVPALNRDLAETLNRYSVVENTITSPTERIKAFVRRADAMADNKRNVYVTLSVEKGRINLSFLEGVYSSDEFHLVEELDVPDMAEIKVDARRLARALTSATDIGLDHIKRGVLVLMGDDPAFCYLITGREA